MTEEFFHRSVTGVVARDVYGRVRVMVDDTRPRGDLHPVELSVQVHGSASVVRLGLAEARLLASYLHRAADFAFAGGVTP